MSDEDDLLALLIASVMVEYDALGLKAQDILEELSRRIADGDRTAKDILRNPWNTSVPASRKVPEFETELNELDDMLQKAGPAVLAAWLRRRQLKDQLEFLRLRELGGPRLIGDGTTVPLNPGHQRIVDILIQRAGVTNRDGERASVDILVQAGRLIKRQTEMRWCDELVSMAELSRAKLLQHACVAEGWSIHSGKVWNFEREGGNYISDLARGTLRFEPAPDPDFDPMECRTILPKPLSIDPPGFPRHWSLESSSAMYPVLWDALPAEPFYRSFIRELENGETPPFHFGWPDGSEPVPPFPTLDAMIRFDKSFSDAYKRAERRFRVLDGRLAEMEDVTIDQLASSGRKRDKELLDWVYPVGRTVLLNTGLWDAWRPWGILLRALHDYLEIRDVWDESPVPAWAYYLKGRLASSDAELPAFVRHQLFDWLHLPVPSASRPAVRILVPRDRIELPSAA